MVAVTIECIKTCAQTGARLGRVHTPHGSFDTPAFMPVGTLATVKTMSPDELIGIDAHIILSNTYHLLLRPGHDVVREAGGLHAFMQWPRPILTDSGGFQVFSLSAVRQVTEEGVHFRNHLNGDRIFLGPREAIDIQHALGADIIMAFDECAPHDASESYIEASVRRTTRWAEACLRAHTRADTQALFAIVQGGLSPVQRVASARDLTAMDFPGYAIGGLSVGESKEQLYGVLDTVVPLLPTRRPRYLMGVGSPDALIEGAMRGIDMFDCVLPTRIARNGTVMTSTGRLVLKKSQYARDFRPIDASCTCPTCRTHTRAYVRHLLHAGEVLGIRLTTVHNVHFLLTLMRNIREAIAHDRLASFKEEFFAAYGMHAGHRGF
ncbi:MAG: tRNA guanosine(34) transglycosylase Tgt [Paenibacillaceae bacterium]|nr:tRNA guanosine(34) transglycosylase Tgt [Paenibacillaceae bacterium]